MMMNLKWDGDRARGPLFLRSDFRYIRHALQLRVSPSLQSSSFSLVSSVPVPVLRPVPR